MENENDIIVDDNPETELLAAMLQRYVWPTVKGRITADDFEDIRNRTVFEAIAWIEGRGRISDVTYVGNRLKDTCRLHLASHAYVLAVAKKKRHMSVENAIGALQKRRREKA